MERVEGEPQSDGTYVCERKQVSLRVADFAFGEKKKKSERHGDYGHTSGGRSHCLFCKLEFGAGALEGKRTPIPSPML